MKTTVIVADSARARIFETGTVIDQLEEREAFVHSEAHLMNTDLVSDSAGKSSHLRGTLNPPTPAKEHEAQNFAKLLGRHLKELHNQRHFENLVLIAPPKFLGMLRNELLRPVDKLVTFTIDKDLSTASIESIIGHIKS